MLGWFGMIEQKKRRRRRRRRLYCKWSMLIDSIDHTRTQMGLQPINVLDVTKRQQCSLNEPLNCVSVVLCCVVCSVMLCCDVGNVYGCQYASMWSRVKENDWCIGKKTDCGSWHLDIDGGRKRIAKLEWEWDGESERPRQNTMINKYNRWSIGNDVQLTSWNEIFGSIVCVYVCVCVRANWRRRRQKLRRRWRQENKIINEEEKEINDPK